MPDDLSFSQREFATPLDHLTPAQRLAAQFEANESDAPPLIPTRMYSMRLPVDTMIRVDTFAAHCLKSRVQTSNALLLLGLDAVYRELSAEGRKTFDEAVRVEIEKFCAEVNESARQAKEAA